VTIRLSRHAQEEMMRGQIPREWVDALLDAPEQTIVQPGGTEIRQSRFAGQGGKMFFSPRRGGDCKAASSSCNSLPDRQS
jgi:hypothetical protein